MRLTPLDIRKQEFTRGFRGYEPEEVNAFLQMLSSQWDEVLDDSRRKDDRIRELESKMEHYSKVEEALQEALQTTRDTSRKALQNAEEKARLIVQEAERRAEDIKRNAEQDRHQIKRETAKLSGRRSEIISRLRAFLMSEMELLARFEGDDPMGFFKLVPAEEQRSRPASASGRRGSGSSSPSAARASEGSSQGTAESSRRSAASAEPQSADRDDDRARSSSFQSGAEDRTSDVREYEGDTGRSEDRDYEPTSMSDRDSDRNSSSEVIHGPGWTARTVISRASEQAVSSEEEEEDPLDYLDDDAEGDVASDESDGEKPASSEEMEKIRRILSDLD